MNAPVLPRRSNQSAYPAIVAWEIRVGLRRVSTWVYAALFTSLGFIMMSAAAGRWPEATVALGGGGKILADSPFSLTILINAVAMFCIPVTAAIAGNALYRDYETGAFPLFYTTPVSRFAFLGARFTAALALNALILLAITVGAVAAVTIPGFDSERVGGGSLVDYALPYAVLVLPNLLFTAALFFALVSLTRQMLPNYVGGALLLIGYLIASGLAADLPNKDLAALIDPFGREAVQLTTRYWSIAEKNERLVTLDGLLLANRAIWMTAGLAILAFAFARFRFSQALPTPRTRPVVATPSPVSPLSPLSSSSPSSPLAPRLSPRSPRYLTSANQFTAIFRRSFLGIVLNRYFAIIVAAALLFLVVAVQEAGKMYGTTTYPVTYQVEEIVSGLFGLFMLVLIAFYSGELVWAERDAGMAHVHDSTPTPTGVVLSAKLAALCAMIVILVAVTMLCGIATQVWKGYFRFEIPLYLQSLFGVRLVDYLLLAVLAMAVHVVVNHKYLGHLAVLLAFIGTGLLSAFGFEHNLYSFASDGGSTYSDMNRYGPFIGPFVLWKAYWGAFAVLMCVAMAAFWVRGQTERGSDRLRAAARRANRSLRLTAAAAAVAFVGLGGYIYYNTNVLNDYVTLKELRRARAEYERRYKRYEYAPQPRITAVRVNVDLYPSRGELAVRGSYTLRNRTEARIDTIHLRISQDLRIDSLTFAGGSTRVLADPERDYYMYRLSRPLAPYDSIRMSFALTYDKRGFPNSIDAPFVAENGTFVPGEAIAPGIGYASQVELAGEKDRKKEGLPPVPRMQPRTDTTARRNMYVSPDADWITFEATVSTDSGQTAIAPGPLVRDWTENGRRHFQFGVVSRMLPLWAVLSARYEVKRAAWREIPIEIYYHAAHAYNVDRMIASVQQSLDYLTRAFGPYQHTQVRILEFPRYASFAQSLPNTIPYSEAIGFIARIEAPADIDYPFYVTAHEVAHQWFAHQVVGGNVAGSTVLSETLSQYAALMVMEDEFGPANMKRFLEYELDKYLTGRSAGIKEEPLAVVENTPHIHYSKGALAMYALRDYLGETRLNAAIARFLNDTRYQDPPYASTLELLETLRAAAPDSLNGVIDDLFERITLFELRTDSVMASQSPDSSWRVTIFANAKKVYADSVGVETETTMSEWVDVGVYPPAGSATRGTTPIYLAKHRLVSGAQTIEVTVSERPGAAGIDPLNKLIDRGADQRDNVKFARIVKRE